MIKTAAHMEPFNIRIKIEQHETTLTILPMDNETDFKVIYNGAVLGGVQRKGTTWKSLPDEEVEPGDLPLYKVKFGEDNSDIEINEEMVALIGVKIEKELQPNL